VVFDGNSLAFNTKGSILRKPWLASTSAPLAEVIRREERHPAPRLEPAFRKLLRKLLHSGTVACSREEVEAATRAVEVSCPGFTDILDHITCDVADEDSQSENAAE
jgi:hypothetical protein